MVRHSPHMIRRHEKAVSGGASRLETRYGQEIGALGPRQSRWGMRAFLVGFTAVAVLASYMVSMKVSDARSAVDRLVQENAAITREMKSMNDELRVRMRLPQLQLWNDSVFGMTSISAEQYLAAPADLAAFGVAPTPAPAETPALQYAITEPRAPAVRPRIVAAPATPERPAVRLVAHTLVARTPAATRADAAKPAANARHADTRRRDDPAIWNKLPAYEEVPHIVRASRPVAEPAGPTDLLQQIALNQVPMNTSSSPAATSPALP